MKAEHYHPNPAVRRAREKASEALGGGISKPKGDEDQGQHGPVHRTEVEHNPKTGKHVVKAHHEDGHVATSEHNSAQEAHSHAASLHGGETNPEDKAADQVEQEDMGGEGGAPNDNDADDQGAGGDETQCPNCGHEMEKGGKCPQCGYEDEGSDEGEGGGGEEEDGGGY